MSFFFPLYITLSMLIAQERPTYFHRNDLSGESLLLVQICQFLVHVLDFIDDTSPIVFVNSYFLLQVVCKYMGDLIMPPSILTLRVGCRTGC